MFRVVGQTVARYWPVCLVFWLLAIVGMEAAAPPWNEVVTDGEFSFLPADVDSRRGEELFKRAFSHDILGSSVVVVARRANQPQGLLTLEEVKDHPSPPYSDEEFIDKILKPRIELIQLLTDIAAAYSKTHEERAALYLELSTLISELWKEAGRRPNADSHSRIRRRMERAERLIGLAAAVARDSHADLFKDEEDPDPETGAETPLRERVRRQMQAMEIPLAELGERWQERLRQPGDTAAPPVWNYELPSGTTPQPVSIIQRIRTPSDRSLGHLLTSQDGQAALVMVELRTEFLKRENRRVIEKIERLVGSNDEKGELYYEKLVPPGLSLALSGSATVGRDMREAAVKSADATHATTLLLVVVLLLLIYRAPILVLIPLLTVFISVEIALAILACLAQRGYVGLFSGIEIYSTVVMYGAGVDYCMFLIARYKEELDAGGSYEESIAESIGKVGAALAASAGTTMCGIGMMVFADFGKFRQAGVAMSFGLFFVLCAALTFAPALLRLFGRWAFWPYMRTEHVPAAPGWVSPTSLVARLLEKNWLNSLWDRIGQGLVARPGTILLASVAAMLPFAIVAVLCYNNLSYGLLSELPPDETSVIGAKIVQQHFPAGQTGPVTILLQHPRLDFRRGSGRGLVESLTAALWKQRDKLAIADIRSVADPFGMSEAGQRHFASLSIPQKAGARKKANEHYVADKGELSGHVTRIDVVFQEDPFSRDSIDRFEDLKRAVVANLPAELADGPEPLYVGATASIRDLKAVTNRDQVRIDTLVILSVFLVLLLLLRKPAVSGYLIVSVFFSYLVTLGLTFVVFWALDPQGFAGLDWKVPMFLFTILIAVGEDYNIYLITRIEEEQQEHGPIQGAVVALSKTGKIISGCGIIMAGTFSSLLISGELAGMRQLGFALAFGVLLDTFVVRPILVPAYLILLHSGRFGHLGRYLGASVASRSEAGSRAPQPPAKERKRSA